MDRTTPTPGSKVMHIYEEFTRVYIFVDGRYFHLWDDYSMPGNPSGRVSFFPPNGLYVED